MTIEQTEKNEKKTTESTKRKKSEKFLSILDKISIVVAISLGISTAFVSTEKKPILMFAGIIPAVYLATRSVILLRELKKNSKSINPLIGFYALNLWIQLLINSVAAIANPIVALVLIYYYNI